MLKPIQSDYELSTLIHSIIVTNLQMSFIFTPAQLFLPTFSYETLSVNFFDFNRNCTEQVLYPLMSLFKLSFLIYT